MKAIWPFLVILLLSFTLHIQNVGATDDDLRHPDDTSLRVFERSYERTNDTPYFQDTTLSLSPASLDASSRINDIFNRLGTAGSAYNAGGGDAVAQALLENGCQFAIGQVSASPLLTGLQDDIQNSSLLPGMARSFLADKTGQLGQVALGAACMALRGQEMQSIDLRSTAQSELFPLLMMAGQTAAHESGLPFLKSLEVETGIENGELYGSLTSVQPLWNDEAERNHVFTQLSWYRTNDDKYADTVNAGIAYRNLNESKDLLLGANLFLDHAYERNHNRMSIGIDARTSLMGLSANRYMPLSSWRSVDALTEERATAGWDLELRGQTPSLPSWTGSLKGYTWDGHGGNSDTFGVDAGVEYSPVPALAIRAAVNDETDEDASLDVALRFKWRFDQPADLQLKPRLALSPVSDLVYEKVHRENRIRVAQRLKASAYLLVAETSGANTVLSNGLTQPLSVGQNLIVPVTLTIANTVGAYGRFNFSDGAVLTIAQNSQVRVEPERITLISGSFQYTSGGVTRLIAIPGGTIELLGTDIDVISDGTTSTVRVRDGTVRLTGTASGSVTLTPSQMGSAISGVVAAVAPGSATYTAHADSISRQIDLVANPLNVEKAAPYPTSIPEIVQEDLNPGGIIRIALSFSKPVVVSGGTPNLNLTIAGVPRTAALVSGSGTATLLFDYTVDPADTGNTIIVTALDANGANLSGTDGKLAVTTIADSTITLSGSLSTGDVTPPSGYTVAFTTDPVAPGNVTAVAFSITDGEIGATFDYSITGTSGAPVTGSGTITTTPQTITGLDVSGLADGTLTLSVTLTDAAANIGGAVTDTVVKDALAPTILSVTAPANGTYGP